MAAPDRKFKLWKYHTCGVFLYISQRLKVCWAQKIRLLHLKYQFCCPLDYASQNGHTTRPTFSWICAVKYVMSELADTPGLYIESYTINDTVWTTVATKRLRWCRSSVLAFGTQVRGFRAKIILSTPSFGGEVKPSVPCRRFAACKRFQNGVEDVISAKLPDNILAHSSTFRR